MALAYKIAPEKVEKAVIETDLFALFMAISDKYGIAVCADLIQEAMELTSDNYKKDA